MKVNNVNGAKQPCYLKIFTARNLKEMAREPLLYIFCIAFPLVMLILFAVIGKYAGESAMFTPKTMLPGIVMFSFTFIMLATTLHVSRDRTSAFLIRLFTSPLKPFHYVAGYVIPFFLAGILQMIVCILAEYLISVITGEGFFSFGATLLLMVEMLPFLLTCLFFGIGIGSVFSDKSSPAITSIIISASGVLGGAWMPLDTMGGFATFCLFLPFYPTVYLGRIITGATHTVLDVLSQPTYYTFDTAGIGSLVCIFIYLLLSVAFALFAFTKQMKRK
jgi:ABC-2 type transport system permease protein